MASAKQIQEVTLVAVQQSGRDPHPTKLTDHPFLLIFRHIVELLLTYEASCNAADEKGSSPLHLAAWAGFGAIVDTLLVHGPSVANANLTVFERFWSRNLASPVIKPVFLAHVV